MSGSAEDLVEPFGEIVDSLVPGVARPVDGEFEGERQVADDADQRFPVDDERRVIAVGAEHQTPRHAIPQNKVSPHWFAGRVGGRIVRGSSHTSAPEFVLELSLRCPGRCRALLLSTGGARGAVAQDCRRQGTGGDGAPEITTTWTKRLLALLLCFAFTEAACGTDDDPSDAADANGVADSEEDPNRDDVGGGEVDYAQAVGEAASELQSSFAGLLDDESVARCVAGFVVAAEFDIVSEIGSESNAHVAHYVLDVCTAYGGAVAFTPCAEANRFPEATLTNAFLAFGEDVSMLSGEDGWVVDDATLGPAERILYVDEDAAEFRSFEEAVTYPDSVTVEPVRIYLYHPGWRAHRVHVFDPSGSPIEVPELLPDANGEARVTVVDAGGAPGAGKIGGHGQFVAAIVETMTLLGTEETPQRPQLVEINPVMKDGASTPYPTAIDNTDVAFITGIEALNSIPTAADVDTPSVINLSFGAYSCDTILTYPEGSEIGKVANPSSELSQRLSSLQENGVTIVASAGNDETDQLVYPAALPGVVAVGSKDAAGNRSCFSNYGQWVDVWEVGEEVYASGGTNPAWEGTWSGTSFAAPQRAARIAVVGAGALGPEPGPSNSLTPGPVYSNHVDYGGLLWSACAGTSFGPPPAQQ